MGSSSEFECQALGGLAVEAELDHVVVPAAAGLPVLCINDSRQEALVQAREGARTPFVIEHGGEKVRSVRKGMERAAARAGVRATPHVLRHTDAVWMAEAGVSIHEIANYLGDTDIKTTVRAYARHSPDYLRDAAEALEV